MSFLQKGDKNNQVGRLQRNLETLGYPLVRWGADGILGEETLEAVDEWGEDNNIIGDVTPCDSISEVIFNKINDERRNSEEQMGLVLDVRKDAWKGRRKTKNKISRVDTIVLHQMSVIDSDDEGWIRWRKMAIHYIATAGKKSKGYWLHDVDYRMGHAQNFNSRSIGIETEGYFAGIEGDLKTFWKPKSKPNRQPMTPSDEQILALKDIIRHAYKEATKKGMEIKYIGAHRQSYGIKTSDPGEYIWRNVAIPMMEELGLKTAPVCWHHKYPGKPIPEAWGGKKGTPYR
tara:strand:- start:21283 stop:22146 length:864 start_codon:yes stop_codon:yes gene_type:complete